MKPMLYTPPSLAEQSSNKIVDTLIKADGFLNTHIGEINTRRPPKYQNTRLFEKITYEILDVTLYTSLQLPIPLKETIHSKIIYHWYVTLAHKFNMAPIQKFVLYYGWEELNHLMTN